MSKKKWLSTILVLFISLFFLSGFSQTNKSFSFTLSEGASTSAGIFTVDGTLIRTLWSGVHYESGDHTNSWDGLLDDHTIAPEGDYHVEVLSNNVSYQWEGAKIGNTSNAFVGSTKHRAPDIIACMAIAGDNIYYGSNYNEGFSAQFKTNVSDPQQRTSLGPGGTNQGTQFVCTDGINAYWGGYDPGQGSGPGETFVFATRVSDNAFVTFSYGMPAAMDIGITYASTIAHQITDNNYLSGMAVQKTGKYLFVSRGALNQLSVVEKTTGQLMQTLTVSGIKKLCIDRDDDLWISTATGAAKYSVNPDGSITATGVAITGLNSVAAIAVSPDNATVYLADDDATQQVIKGYSNSSGGSTALWTLGTPGGYMTSSTVTNYKFYFRDSRTNYLTDIAFQDDGSFWVIDGGNYRAQHYSSSRTYIDRIMYMPATYLVQLDPNNPKRIFGNYLEFSRDYSIPLGTANGSWELVANWGGVIPDNVIAEERLRSPITLSNGKTYYKARSNVNTNTFPIMELVPNGIIRPTGIIFDTRTVIANDGSKWFNPEGSLIGSQSHVYRYTLTGFSGTNNDPQWSGASEVIATTPTLTSRDPVPSSTIYSMTSTEKIVFFNPDAVHDGAGEDMHLGVIKKGYNKYLWKTSRGTTGYQGDFPPDGSFDNFNGVVYAGGFSLALGQNIFWSYHGEFWKQSQTNKFNHYWDNGLFVGQFGTISSDHQGEESFAGGAGNALAGSIAEVDGVIYLYHCDESVNAGVHSWKIVDLNTIKNQSCTFYETLKPAIITGIDLMANLMPDTILTSAHGWALTGQYEFNDNGRYWDVTTGSKSYDPFLPTDIYALYVQPSGNRIITRDLGSNIGLSSWSVNGQISFDRNSANDLHNDGGSYFEILDHNDKIISRFYESTDFKQYYFLNGNDKILIKNSDYERRKYITKDQHFGISCTNGVLTFTYASYTQSTSSLVDSTANWQNPSKIRLYFFTNNMAYKDFGRAMDVKGLSFSQGQELQFRSAMSGNWNDVHTWQSSLDNITWGNATTIPSDSAGTITIQNNHTVTITNNVKVDQLTINGGGVLNVSPKASLAVNDGPGNDIIIQASASMVIQSDSTGTGRIGNSSGTVYGNVTVERYISSSKNASYRLLSPSVNTANTNKPFVRDNWQEGQNNTSVKVNNNRFPKFGIHITGSVNGGNGFDATSKGTASLFSYNPTNAAPSWVQATNTNATTMEAKKGYLVIVFGDRSTDLRTSKAPSSTILRATGSLLTGTQIFSKPSGDRGTYLVGNPYASPINWNTIYNDVSTNNSKNLENYYTYWDPYIGTGGGYVTVNANGVKSAPTNATTEIQSGQAFLVKPKKGVVAPALTIKESHKSATNNQGVFRVAPQTQLMSSLYFSTSDGIRVMTDAVNTVFDNESATDAGNHSAEEIANFDENIAIEQDDKMLSIDERPLRAVDTLKLIVQRLKAPNYEWQFDPTNLTDKDIKAWLIDKFLNTRTSISLDKVTVINFSVNSNITSSKQDRFQIVFEPSKAAVAKETSVQILDVTGKIDVYPNPISIESPVVQFSNIPKGNYTVTLLNESGQILYKKSVIHPGGSASQTIQVDSHLPAGIYNLKITGNGHSFNRQLIKIRK